MGWKLDDYGVSAALMAVGGLLLAARLRPARARVAWLALLIAGIGNDVALNLSGTNPSNTNYVHYYLGAKYAVPYDDFYKLIQAALDRPQVEIRDLDHPARMLRAEPHEQRAYYIDLLRSAGVTFDALAPLDTLARRAQESGAVLREAEATLRRDLPAGRIEPFRRDVRTALAVVPPEAMTADFGFNGSPFYGAVRHLDPTLYRPFGRETAYLNLLVQSLAVLLIAWCAGAALGLAVHERIAIAALLFASSDCASFALSGLLFGEFWVAIAVAALAMRHRLGLIAGLAIAWAGLMKIFPFVLLMAALAGVLRRGRAGEPARAWRWSLAMGLGCLAGTLVLAWVSGWSGLSWSGFAHKIGVQFLLRIHAVNGVSRSSELFAMGYDDAAIDPILSLAALIVAAALFLRRDGEAVGPDLARRALVLVACLGWVMNSWLNYYALAPLLLLPFYARQHRAGATWAASAMAVAFLLPGWSDPLMLSSRWLHALKLIPYLAIPAWMLAMELRGLKLGLAARRAAAAATALLVLLIIGDAARTTYVKRLIAEAAQRMASNDPHGAADAYGRALWLDPGNGMAHMNEAIALATAGDLAAAVPHFARAAALLPEDPAAQDNYGRALILVGRNPEASLRLEKARALSPADPRILIALARLRIAQGRRHEAAALLARARELEPDDPTIAQLLATIS